MYQSFLNNCNKKLTQLYHGAIDHVISPPFCAYCKKFLTTRMIFCIECYQLIDPVVSVQITLSKQYTMTVMAVSGYQEPLKTLILAKAWSDIVACNQLAQLIWEMTYFKHLPCDYLIPVPLHWMRFAKRGYNQTQEIAHVLGKYRNISVADILSRIKNTPFQSSLALDKRADNVKHAFALKNVDAALYHNKHLVLVDDLMTTGSTLINAAKALQALKPASINVILACRAI